MSNHSISNESVTPATSEDRCRYRRMVASLRDPAQQVCFWLAIALPFVHVPLLAQGLGSQTVSMAFFSLLGLNVMTLYIGHGYNQTD